MKLGRIIDAASVLMGAALAFGYTRLMARKNGRDHESSEFDADVAGALAAADLDPSMRKVLDWRIRNLEDAGFDELRANTIATVGDWRRAIELVKDGCEHHVAADIVL